MVAVASDAARAEVLAVARQAAAIVRRVTGDPHCGVVLSGSWATGRANERSDIDVAIAGARPER